MNYNTEPELWKNLHKVEKERPVLNRLTLTLVDGQIHDGKDFIGRFSDDSHAINTMTQAGWTCNQCQEGTTFSV